MLDWENQDSTTFEQRANNDLRLIPRWSNIGYAISHALDSQNKVEALRSIYTPFVLAQISKVRSIVPDLVDEEYYRRKFLKPLKECSYKDAWDIFIEIHQESSEDIQFFRTVLEVLQSWRVKELQLKWRVKKVIFILQQCMRNPENHSAEDIMSVLWNIDSDYENMHIHYLKEQASRWDMSEIEKSYDDAWKSSSFSLIIGIISSLDENFRWIFILWVHKALVEGEFLEQEWLQNIALVLNFLNSKGIIYLRNFENFFEYCYICSQDQIEWLIEENKNTEVDFQNQTHFLDTLMKKIKDASQA